MNSKIMTKKNVWILAASFCIVLSMGFLVQAAMGDTNTPDGNAPKKSEAVSSGTIGNLWSVKDMIGSHVKNNQGQTLGSVKEVILVASQNTVSYAVLSAEDKHYPVPWSAFEERSGRMAKHTRLYGQMDVNSDQNLLPDKSKAEHKEILGLNISREQFMQAPTIDIRDIQQLSSSEFQQKVKDFYSQWIPSMQRGTTEMMHEKMEITTGVGQRTGVFSSSEIIGLNVQNPKGEKLAKLKDVIFDTRNGDIAYGLVSFGGLAGVGEKTAAVPWTSLNIQPDNRMAELNATTKTLEESEIKEHQLYKLSDSQFASRIYENFGAEPYWSVYGFVPGEKPVTGSMEVWQAGSSYNKNFKTADMANITGTIEKVGTFHPEKGAAAGLELKVKTDMGQTVTIQAGPSHFIKQQGLKFKKGESISITGSKTMVGNESVIMPTEITAEGKMLKLRDSQGNPLWMSAGTSQPRGTEMEKEESEQEDNY